MDATFAEMLAKTLNPHKDTPAQIAKLTG